MIISHTAILYIYTENGHLRNCWPRMHSTKQRYRISQIINDLFKYNEWDGQKNIPHFMGFKTRSYFLFWTFQLFFFFIFYSFILYSLLYVRVNFLFIYSSSFYILILYSCRRGNIFIKLNIALRNGQSHLSRLKSWFLRNLLKVENV